MFTVRLGFAAVLISINTAAVSDTLDYRQLLEILSEPEAQPSVIAVASGFGASAGAVFAAISYTDKSPAFSIFALFSILFLFLHSLLKSTILRVSP